MDTLISRRAARAKELVLQNGELSVGEYALRDSMPRYLAIEKSDNDTVLELQEAETLPEMVKLLEHSTVEDTITEIHDLDTGEILRPDFKRFYKVLRIYQADTVVFES